MNDTVQTHRKAVLRRLKVQPSSYCILILIGELAPEEPSQDGPQNVSRAPVEAKPLVSVAL